MGLLVLMLENTQDLNNQNLLLARLNVLNQKRVLRDSLNPKVLLKGKSDANKPIFMKYWKPEFKND
jgi:hypothetical protein